MSKRLALFFLLVSSLGFSEDTGFKIDPDPAQLTTIIFASVVLVGSFVMAPYTAAYAGSVQIENLGVPYWAIDLAAALIALAALNYTWKELNDTNEDGTSTKVPGFRAGSDPTHLNTMILASVVLVGTFVAAPYTIAYSGSIRVGSFQIPYWAIDLAAALTAIAALNHTRMDLDQTKTSVRVLGFQVGQL
jgi:hypothetical protein